MWQIRMDGPLFLDVIDRCLARLFHESLQPHPPHRMKRIQDDIADLGTFCDALEALEKMRDPLQVLMPCWSPPFGPRSELLTCKHWEAYFEADHNKQILHGFLARDNRMPISLGPPPPGP